MGLRFTVFLLTAGYYAAAAGGRIGTSLSVVADWSTEQAFSNIFKSSRPWITQNATTWDTGEEDHLDVDENGWIRSLPSAHSPLSYRFVGTLMLRGMGTHYPAGQYTVLYDGDGTLEYGLAARKDPAASTPGRDIIDVTPDNGGIYLKITRTSPTNPIRNIRVYYPASDSATAQSVFNPLFLERLKPYSVLRFLNWQRANDTPAGIWQQRTPLAASRYSGKRGVPPEIMIALAAQTGTDPWFTLPHLANDAYVREFALYARQHLPALARVYLEYSNEIWNNTFLQGKWVEQQAVREWPDSSSSGFTRRINWYAKRSVEICTIWKQVWADQAERVHCIIAAQAANPWVAQQALLCPLAENVTPCASASVSALAIGPYFGGYLGKPRYQATLANWSKDEDGGTGKLFRELESGGLVEEGPAEGALAQSLGWIRDHVRLARQHKLELVAYEAGQHLVGVGDVVNNEQLTRLFLQSNRDPRMKQLYDRYLAGWKQAGGGLLMHYLNTGKYGKWGSWGAMEFPDRNDAPKYQSILEYQRARP